MTSANSRLWWADPGWMASAHQARLPLPSTAGHGRENTTKSLWVETGEGEISQGWIHLGGFHLILPGPCHADLHTEKDRSL